jgi:hypothetical protein
MSVGVIEELEAGPERAILGAALHRQRALAGGRRHGIFVQDLVLIDGHAKAL